MSGSRENEPRLAGDEPADAVSAEVARYETVPAAEPPAGGSRLGLAALSGAVGGAIAAILIGLAINASGVFERPDPVLTGRVGSLEGLATELRSNTAALGQQFSALEQRPTPEPDLTPLRDETEALRDDLADLRDTLADQGTAAETARASLDQGLRELRETASGMALSLAEQRARVDALTSQVAGLEPLAADLQAAKSATAAQDGKLADLAKRLDALATQTSALQPLTGGLQAAQSAIAAQDGKLADLARRLEPLESTLVATRVSSAQTAGLALALIELDRALDAGEPLAAALEPFAPLTTDPAIKAPIDMLEPLRDRGAPTVADLQASLSRLQPQIAEAIRHGNAEGWLDKTAQNLASLVDLRRVDAAEAAVTAKLTDAEQALGRGEVDAAARSLQPLADSGNAAAAEWLAEARRRIDGEAGLERLRAYLASHMPAVP